MSFPPPPPDTAPGTTLPASVAAPLRIRGLTKRFGSTVALDRLELTVPAGSCFGLVGPNGSGKSTTLRSVVGLVRPDAGFIEVCGIDAAHRLTEARARMGVVLDPLQLFERLTPHEFLRTIGELRRLTPEIARERADQLLTTLQLGDDADRQIAGFSHGMRKKTALAAALLHRPRLLLLDEPFEGVDPVSARTIRAMLDRFRAGGGTVVFSSHVMDLVERLCDHVGVIDRGRVVAQGTTAQLSAGRPLEEVFIDVVGATADDGELVGWLG
jgi:ABC-2 type transport system ATP-binding protein